MAEPQDAKAGDPVSASFLNYCKDGVASFATMEKGIQEPADHHLSVGVSRECDFTVRHTSDLPPYSVFALQEPQSSDYINRAPYLSVSQFSASSSTNLYTNEGREVKADVAFAPFRVDDYSLAKLKVDPAAGILSGDICKPEDSGWIVVKGGDSLLCITDPDADDLAWFLALPTGSGRQRIGFIINNDIAPHSAGEVELFDYNYIPNGTVLQVYNSHGVTFHEENTISGEEHPADNVIVFEVAGWDLPLIFPWMLSECNDLVPTFDPVDI